MEWHRQGETGVIWEMTVPVPLYIPRILQRLAWGWIRVFKLRGMAFYSCF